MLYLLGMGLLVSGEKYCNCVLSVFSNVRFVG